MTRSFAAIEFDCITGSTVKSQEQFGGGRTHPSGNALLLVYL